jgi:hypothetical protein
MKSPTDAEGMGLLSAGLPEPMAGLQHSCSRLLVPMEWFRLCASDLNLLSPVDLHLLRRRGYLLPHLSVLAVKLCIMYPKKHG